MTVSVTKTATTMMAITRIAICSGRLHHGSFSVSGPGRRMLIRPSLCQRRREPAAAVRARFAEGGFRCFAPLGSLRLPSVHAGAWSHGRAEGHQSAEPSAGFSSWEAWKAWKAAGTAKARAGTDQSQKPQPKSISARWKTITAT